MKEYRECSQNIVRYKNVKFLYVIFFAICLLFALLLCSDICNAKSKDLVKEAFNQYYKDNIIEYTDPYPDASNQYKVFLDINSDGIVEMICWKWINRAEVEIFTYNNGKIKCIKHFNGVNQICFKKSEKKIVVFQSSGAADNSCTVYKMQKNKLKRYVRYMSKSYYKGSSLEIKYYKNKKIIAKETFQNKISPYFDWKQIKSY